MHHRLNAERFTIWAIVDAQKLVEVVTRIGGVHAQLMSAAKLSLCARLGEFLGADVDLLLS